MTIINVCTTETNCNILINLAHQSAVVTLWPCLRLSTKLQTIHASKPIDELLCANQFLKGATELNTRLHIHSYAHAGLLKHHSLTKSSSMRRLQLFLGFQDRNIPRTSMKEWPEVHAAT
jgi:hypothetical protein